MDMNYKTTVIAMSIHNESDNPIFGESATHVKIEDEAAGPFIVLSQGGETLEVGEVRFDFDEFDVIVAAVKQLNEGWPLDEK